MEQSPDIRMTIEEFAELVGAEADDSAKRVVNGVMDVLSLKGDGGVVYLVRVSDDIEAGDLLYLNSVFDGLDIAGAIVPASVFDVIGEVTL